MFLYKIYLYNNRRFSSLLGCCRMKSHVGYLNEVVNHSLTLVLLHKWKKQQCSIGRDSIKLWFEMESAS